MWCEFNSGNAPKRYADFGLWSRWPPSLYSHRWCFCGSALVDKDRVRLLHDSQESIRKLKRIQNQFVQSEKLASLGQLAAGAAHEINNPLTAILGYSDVLLMRRRHL